MDEDGEMGDVNSETVIVLQDSCLGCLNKKSRLRQSPRITLKDT